MPRIYYNQTDHDVQLMLFVVHIVVYAVAVIMIWLRVILAPVPMTILWTMLAGYHSYWRTSLTDGTQIRTYTRLRNRFGKDWDLAASPEEFDLESKKALLELKLRHVLMDSSPILVVGGAMALFLMLISEASLFSFVMSVFAGWLLIVIALQVGLRRQLQQNRARYDNLKKKQQDASVIQTQNLELKPEQSFIIGDDGELVEVSRQSSQETP